MELMVKTVMKHLACAQKDARKWKRFKNGPAKWFAKCAVWVVNDTDHASVWIPSF